MEKELKIIHTADTHLGYRQYYSDVRRQDFFKAFKKVISDAIEMQADAVVHAGDLFDSRTPTLEDILDTIKLFTTLKNAEIPLLAIVGNHESKQTTQWLDLFESMGLAVRLNTNPYMLENIAFYGIDNVSKSKIPTYDFSIFKKSMHSKYNILVMHQLMSPIISSEWDCSQIIDSMPFHVDAILLGDYHKYEKIKVDNTWVTYCGSTERNSLAEMENRSYNIITISQDEIDISRKTITTRDFLKIPVTIHKNDKIYDKILATVQEYDIKDKVVFVEINSDDTNISISQAEIEEMMQNRGALIAGVIDLINKTEIINEPLLSINFYDPDETVKKEIQKMNLSDGGLLIDEIVRDLSLVKTKVSDETEKRLDEMFENIDFSKPIVSKQKRELDSDTYFENINNEINVSDPNLEDKKVSDPSVNLEDKIIEKQNKKKINEENKAVSIEKKTEKKSNNVSSSKPKQYNLGDYF